MKARKCNTIFIRNRVLLLGLTTALCSGLAAPAFAQIAPPIHTSVDANGVDLISGNYVTTITE